jgi:hypothetical protein
MAYEDLIAGTGWTNLPPPQFGGGEVVTATNLPTSAGTYQSFN